MYSIDGVEYVAVMAGIGGVFSLESGLNHYGYRYGTGRPLLAFRLGGMASFPLCHPSHPSWRRDPQEMILTSFMAKPYTFLIAATVTATMAATRAALRIFDDHP